MDNYEYELSLEKQQHIDLDKFTYDQLITMFYNLSNSNHDLKCLPENLLKECIRYLTDSSKKSASFRGRMNCR